MSMDHGIEKKKGMNAMNFLQIDYTNLKMQKTKLK